MLIITLTFSYDKKKSFATLPPTCSNLYLPLKAAITHVYATRPTNRLKCVRNTTSQTDWFSSLSHFATRQPWFSACSLRFTIPAIILSLLNVVWLCISLIIIIIIILQFCIALFYIPKVAYTHLRRDFGLLLFADPLQILKVAFSMGGNEGMREWGSSPTFHVTWPHP